MRIVFLAALAGVAVVSLAACNRTPAAGGQSSAVAAAGGAAPTGPLSADQVPHRKPGLWKQTVSMDGGSAGPGAMEFCVDPASEAKMNIAVQHMPGATCTAPQLTRNLDGSISVTSSCDLGANGKSQTTGTIKGDFNTSYVATMATTMTGSPVPAMNGAHTMVLTGSYVGPCAAGEVGGDMIMADGTKMNALARLSSAPPSGGQ